MTELESGIDSPSHLGAVPSATAEGVSLQDALLLKVGLSWHEAVAILLEAVHQLPEGSPCPDPALVTLTALGEARVMPGRGLSGPPVRRAAGLLLELLASAAAAPQELRALVERDVADSPEHASLGDFARALMYFARPNRRADVAAVHARVHALYLRSSARAELERLRAKASVTSTPAKPGRAWLSLVLSARARTGVLNALLLITIAGSAMALVGVALGPSASLSSAGAVTLPTGVADVVQRTGNALNRALATGQAALGGGSQASRPTAATSQATQTAAPARRVRQASGASVSARTPDRPIDSEVAPLTTTTVDERPIEYTISVREIDFSNADYANLAAGSLEAGDSALPLYGAGDDGISPATLVRPQLPTGPETIAADEPLSVFDLVVSTSGNVEQVRLISPAGRFNDRMLVSAAKAWTFHPALRDGHPVRYRLRVRITQ